jgi:hypothetical protein
MEFTGREAFDTRIAWTEDRQQLPLGPLLNFGGLNLIVLP